MAKPVGHTYPTLLRRQANHSTSLTSLLSWLRNLAKRAYPQQIVTTRLLYCLQDPFAQLSRLQRIRSRAAPNCNTRTTAGRFVPGGGSASWDARPRPILVRLRRAGAVVASGMDS